MVKQVVRSITDWRFIVKSIAAGIIAFSSFLTIFLVGPAIETRFFPVVSKLKIINLGRNADGHAVISADFTKIRDCEYLGLSWFRGDRAKDFERVPIVLLREEGDTSNPNRPQGRQRAGPWIVHMPPEEVARNSFARLHHRCHAFWTTITEFYP